MKKMLWSAAALFAVCSQALAEPGEKSLYGPINHQESRNGAQQNGRAPESRAVAPERMTEIARMLRQVNAMIQKISDTLEHTESADKTAEMSRLTDELSDAMRQVSDQIAGRADPGGLKGLRARINQLYAGMEKL